MPEIRFFAPFETKTALLHCFLLAIKKPCIYWNTRLFELVGAAGIFSWFFKFVCRSLRRVVSLTKSRRCRNAKQTNSIAVFCLQIQWALKSKTQVEAIFRRNWQTGVLACFCLAALSVRSCAPKHHKKTPHSGSFFMVGAAGIEPATPTVWR